MNIIYQHINDNKEISFSPLLLYTVKLGYNELGYNELPVIINKKISLVGIGKLT